MSLNPKDRDKAIQAAVTAMSAFRNYHRDPENGPFEGSEADWLWAEAERATDAVIAALSQAEPAQLETARGTLKYLLDHHADGHECLCFAARAVAAAGLTLTGGEDA